MDHASDRKVSLEGTVAGLKKMISGLLAVLIVVTFVACVYGYGEGGDRVFSFRVWVENLAQIGNDYSLKDDLIIVWTEDHYFWFKYNKGFDEYLRMVETYETVYEGDDEVLMFLSQIPLFFERLWATVRVLFGHIGWIYRQADVLLPWNATVTKEVFYGV